MVDASNQFEACHSTCHKTLVECGLMLAEDLLQPKASRILGVFIIRPGFPLWNTTWGANGTTLPLTFHFLDKSKSQH